MTGQDQAAPHLLDEDLPGIYRSADRASLEGQRRALTWHRALLLLLLFAALMGAVPWSPTRGLDLSGLLGGLAFGFALVLSALLMAENPERQWYLGRAAAESIKTLSWKYAVGGHPFTMGERHVDAVFVARLRQILKHIGGLEWASDIDGQDQVPAAMRRLRAATLGERMTAYERARIDDQRVWYAQRVRECRRAASNWALVAFVFTTGGLVGAFLRAVHWIGFDLLGIAASVTASITAWTQLKQYRQCAAAYAVAVHELNLVRALILEVSEEAEWARLVESTEMAISREHTTWLARHGIA